MSKRYEHLHYCEYRDTETGLVASNYVDVMNEQDQKIKDLEHRLSNCIEPKFKVGQEVWFIDPENDVSSGEVWKIEINCVQTRYTVFFGNDYEDIYFEYEIFATEEDAKARLEELKND